jgi:hypothetical protein
MKHALIYSLKLWLTSVVICLILSWINDWIWPQMYSIDLRTAVFERTVALLILSLAYIIPLFFGIAMMLATDWKQIMIKCVLIFITPFLSWLPIMVLTIATDDIEPLTHTFKIKTLVYIIINCLCVLLYKLRPTIKTPEEISIK